MKNSAISRIELLAVLVVMGTCAFIVLRPSNSHGQRDPTSQRFRKAAAVGNALHRYQETNHRLPSRLSELVPEFVPTSRVNLFFETKNDAKADRNDIDKEGCFKYFGERALSTDVVFCDQMYLWPHDANSTSVVVLTSNLTAHLRAPRELAGIPLDH